MSQFTDAEGHVWTIEILRPHLKAVKRELDLDLLDLGNRDLFERIQNDPALIIDLLWVLLQEEIRRLGLDEYAFARRMRGDVLDQAALAVLGELISFFPSRHRAALEEILHQSRALREATLAHAEQLLASGKIAALARAELEQREIRIDSRLSALIPGKSCTAGADIPEPTPIAAPSGNSDGCSTESSSSPGTSSASLLPPF